MSLEKRVNAMKVEPNKFATNPAARRICSDRAQQIGAHLASWMIGSVLGLTVLAAMKVIGQGVGI